MQIKIVPFLFLAAFIAGCNSGGGAAADKGNTAPATATGPSSAAPASTTPSSGNSVVGTWTNDDKNLPNSTVEFKDDGTFTLHADIPNIKAAADVSATYKINGDKMTETTTSAKITAAADADAKTKEEVDNMNKTMKQNPPETDTISWKDKDTFTLTDASGKAVTFKRK